MDGAFEYATTSKIMPASDYPYTATSPLRSCQYDASKGVYNVTSYCDVEAGNQQALKNAIANRPTSVAIEADELIF